MTNFRVTTLAAVMLLTAGASQAAPNLNINGLTIETGSGKTLGTLSSQGGMDEFTRLQKELVLTVIKQLGIDIESLPPAVRGQIEKPQTSNPLALQAFAKGLDLADKGQFKEAAAAFKEAARHDPGFALASGMARLMPQVNLGGEGGGGALRNMRRAARDEGQRHGERRLNQMNKPGNRMRDLGVSDGRGKKGEEARMDPVDMVSESEEGNKQNPSGGDTRETVVIRTQEVKVIEDVQRDQVDTSFEPVGGDYQGFAAGYLQDCPDGCTSTVIASGSSSAVQIHFRPDEEQVDASLIIQGDMLSGSSSPTVSFSITSQCNTLESACQEYYNAEPVGSYSYYQSNNIFWTYQYDSNTFSYDELVSGYYYYDENQFSHSTWGYWWSWDYYDDQYSNDTTGFGFWVAGELTPAAHIPNSGSAIYSGGMVGVTQDFNTLEGTMNWTVNFSNRTVNGTFEDITKDGVTWLSNVNVNGSWSAGQNLVSANLTGSNVTSGTAKGSFFGPNAEELGGSWRINHSNGDKGAGIFLGKPGGSRFNVIYD